MTRFRAWMTLAILLVAMGAGKPAAAQEDLVDFSFDQVDLHTFIDIVSKHTGHRFIVSPEAGGKITVVTPRIRASQVYPLFLAIIESVNCGVVATEDPGTFRVVVLPERGVPEAPLARETPEGGGIVTRVLRLRHVRASDVAKALQPRLGAADKLRIAALDATDHLIVTDTAPNVRRFELLVAELDQPGPARVTEVVRLRHADAENLARELTAAVAGGMSEDASRAESLRQRLPSAGEGGARSRDAVVVASPHSNSLILVGTQGQVEDLKRVLASMDVDSPAGLNALRLRYLDAEETAKTLIDLLERSGRGTAQGTRRPVAIQASPATRTILVDGTPREYEMVRAVIESLDRPPEQVHINVIIAEVSLDRGLEFGISAAGYDQPARVGDSVLQGSYRLQDTKDNLLSTVQSGIFPRGMTIGVAHGVRLDAAGNLVVGIPGAINIDAQRRRGDVRILASTSLEAENNREASVQIVNNIPLLKSTIQGTGTSRDVIENIDRIDVGIKLTITPHVNPDREIQLKLNPSIEAIIDPGPSDRQFAPTIAKREVSTTVTVRDGQSAVISGLTREDETKIERRVPILGDIPLLGVLFRHRTDVKQRTNLLIMVTPTIVDGPGFAAKLQEAFEERTGMDPTGAERRTEPMP